MNTLAKRLTFSLCLGLLTVAARPRPGEAFKGLDKAKRMYYEHTALKEAVRALEEPYGFRSGGRFRTFIKHLHTVADHLETHAISDNHQLAKVLRGFIKEAATCFQNPEVEFEQGYQTWHSELVKFFARIDELPLPATRRALHEMAESEAKRALEDIDKEKKYNQRLVANPDDLVKTEAGLASLYEIIAGAMVGPTIGQRTGRKTPEDFLDYHIKAGKDPAVEWLAKKFPEVLATPYEELVRVNQELTELATRLLPEAAQRETTNP